MDTDKTQQEHSAAVEAKAKANSPWAAVEQVEKDAFAEQQAEFDKLIGPPEHRLQSVRDEFAKAQALGFEYVLICGITPPDAERHQQIHTFISDCSLSHLVALGNEISIIVGAAFSGMDVDEAREMIKKASAEAAAKRGEEAPAVGRALEP